MECFCNMIIYLGLQMKMSIVLPILSLKAFLCSLVYVADCALYFYLIFLIKTCLNIQQCFKAILFVLSLQLFMHGNTVRLINYKWNYWLHYGGKRPLKQTMQLKLSVGLEDVCLLCQQFEFVEDKRNKKTIRFLRDKTKQTNKNLQSFIYSARLW